MLVSAHEALFSESATFVEVSKWFGDKIGRPCKFLLMFSYLTTRSHPFALSLSKGFDRACPELVEGLSPNGRGVMSYENLNK